MLHRAAPVVDQCLHLVFWATLCMVPSLVAETHHFASQNHGKPTTICDQIRSCVCFHRFHQPMGQVRWRSQADEKSQHFFANRPGTAATKSWCQLPSTKTRISLMCIVRTQTKHNKTPMTWNDWLVMLRPRGRNPSYFQIFSGARRLGWFHWQATYFWLVSAFVGFGFLLEFGGMVLWTVYFSTVSYHKLASVSLTLG